LVSRKKELMPRDGSLKGRGGLRQKKGAQKKADDYPGPRRGLGNAEGSWR